MPYSSQPGTAKLYFTGNSGNTAYPRFTQVLGHDREPKEISSYAQNSTIGAIMNNMGLLPPDYSTSRDSKCAMLFKGFIFSDPLVQTYHTTYSFAQMNAHDESNQNGATNQGTIVSNGLLVIPQTTNINTYDAIYYTDTYHHYTYRYVTDVDCKAVSYIKINGNTNDLHVATTLAGSGRFADGYQHFNDSTYIAEYYQDIKIKILIAEVYLHTADAHGYDNFPYLQITRAKLLVTINNIEYNIEIDNSRDKEELFYDNFVSRVGYDVQRSVDECTYRWYNVNNSPNYWIEQRVDNSTRINDDSPTLKTTGRHESELKDDELNVVSMFMIADFAVGVYSQCGSSDQIDLVAADHYVHVDAIDHDVVQTNPMTFLFEDCIPAEYDDETVFNQIRDAIYASVEIHDDHLIDYAEIKQFEFSNNKYQDNSKEFTFECNEYVVGTVSAVGGIEYRQELEDSLLGTYDITQPMLTSMNQTPMDYYSGVRNNGRVEFDDQLSNKSDETAKTADEPTYFWVETLKNWCYYSLAQIDDACNIAVLNVWNGMDGWLQLDTILENTKKDFISRKRAKELIDLYNQDPTAHPEIKAKLDKYIKLATSLLMIYPFRTETLKTISIDRLYIPKVKPDYKGHKQHHWYDGVVSVVKSLGSSFVDYWVGFWDIVTSPVYIFYGDESMVDRLCVGWKKLGSGLITMMVDYFKLATGLTGGIFVQELYHYLFSSSPADPFSRLDHFSTLYAMCRYVELPYDNGYSSNDKHTYQTIRKPKRFGVAGGIYNRTAIIPCISITSTIGSPFVARTSTGELIMAYDFSYSGPVNEGYSGESDFDKLPGIIQDDVDLTNKILQEQFGKGEDKTIDDWLNTTGNTPDMSTLDMSTVTDFASRLTNGQVAQLTALQKAGGSMVLNANRSKTSSDTDSAIINTVTKW